LASQIRHPNAVEIMDLGEQAGVLYLVMEWIEGVPLNQLMKVAKREAQGVPHRIAVRLTMQACAGLHAAHELKGAGGKLVGLVHRDVSPQNLLVTYEGVTKVVDFGVAKATAIGDGATQAGQIKGKVGYMAPEQVKGDAIDRRVDVFALGIVLYALTTGKHPFRRESEAATMYNICAPQPVMPPRKVVQDYPPELEKVVLKALAKNRDERYTSANELLKALNSLPATLRGTTDHEVGVFVQGLMGARREEQQRALAEALERADQQAESGLRAAAVQAQGELAALAEGGTLATSSAELSSGSLTGLNKRNTGAWIFAALSVLLAGGAVAAYVLTQPIEPIPAMGAPEAAAQPANSSEAPPEEADTDDAKSKVETVGIDELGPSEKVEQAQKEKTEASRPSVRRRAPQASTQRQPAAAKPTAGPKNPYKDSSWDKQNPGF
jgi:serine/threonine-protein kinase